MSGAASKDPVRVRAGLKGAINNPNVPHETKERVQERLDAMSSDFDTPQSEPSEQEDYKDEGELNANQIGGYKATLKNSKVSQEAEDKAEEILEDEEAEY